MIWFLLFLHNACLFLVFEKDHEISLLDYSDLQQMLYFDYKFFFHGLLLEWTTNDKNRWELFSTCQMRWYRAFNQPGHLFTSYVVCDNNTANRMPIYQTQPRVVICCNRELKSHICGKICSKLSSNLALPVTILVVIRDAKLQTFFNIHVRLNRTIANHAWCNRISWLAELWMWAPLLSRWSLRRQI